MRNYFPYISAPHRRWGRRARLLMLLFLVIALFYLWNSPKMDKFSGREDFKKNTQKKEGIKDRVGEQITYDVLLGKVKLGTAKYHHLKKMIFNNKLVHQIMFQTKVMRFKDQEMIYTVISRRELSKLKSIIHSIDNNAFVTIADVHETLGTGFKDF